MRKNEISDWLIYSSRSDHTTNRSDSYLKCSISIPSHCSCLIEQVNSLRRTDTYGVASSVIYDRLTGRTFCIVCLLFNCSAIFRVKCDLK